MSGNPPGEAIRAGCDLSGCVKPDHCFAGNISSGMEIIVCNLTPEYAAMAQELLTDKGYAYEIEPNGELLQFTWQETGFVMEDVNT